MQSKINQAEGDKAEIILTSEAAKMDAINRATGEHAHMGVFRHTPMEAKIVLGHGNEHAMLIQPQLHVTQRIMLCRLAQVLSYQHF